MSKKFILQVAFPVLVFVCLTANAAFGQTAAFSYQGRLSESGNPVTGTRFFRFTLYDENGTAIPGASVEQILTVTNGVFNAAIDFGAGAFSGANRSLEIAVKINAGDAYTVLNPRSDILSAPYSIKSKTADDSTQLGGLDSTRYVQQDAGGNVSIGGNLTVAGSVTYDTVNATTQYNLTGQRVLSNAGNSNLFVGAFAGNVNTGIGNTFVGSQAGIANTVGGGNSFLGSTSGFNNTTGNSNSYFGISSGVSNTTGNANSFFGASAGFNNTASNNSFFGSNAGFSNSTGGFNSFFGFGAGEKNTTGASNAFFGSGAGFNNTTAADNAVFGAEAGFINQTGTRNAFFGRRAGYSNTASRNSFFGFEAGRDNTTGQFNSFFGANAGAGNQTGGGNSFFGDGAGLSNVLGFNNAFFGGLTGSENTAGSNNSFFGIASGLRNQGNDNTFIGFFAAGNAGVTTPLTGARNTVVGSLSASTLTTGSDNSIFGANANFGANNLNFASAFGANSVVNSSDTIVLGKIAGIYNGIARPADTVRIPGLLAVSNLIESTVGGFKFPDGTTQTSAFPGIGSFIQNNPATQQTASFNISGNGILGGNLTFGGGIFGSGAGLTNLNADRITDGTLDNARLGIVPTVKGGTGLFASGIAGNFLRSNGTNWTSSPLATADIPNLDASKITTGVFNSALIPNLDASKITTGILSNARLGIIPVANGGTGLNFTGAAGSFLRSDGTNWTSSPLAAIDIPTNLGTYIQNTTTPQAGANFNIAGTGTANIFSAATQFNLENSRFLSGSQSGGNTYAGFNTGTASGFNNAFFGVNAGAANLASANTFIGFNSGAVNTTGPLNTFIGVGSGISNTAGGMNTFVGAGTGQLNLTGGENSFFGFSAGQRNTADFNSFFGVRAGQFTTSGTSNVFLGWQAGQSNTIGNNNVYIGIDTGGLGQIGSNNTFVGTNAGFANGNGDNNTYLGANTQASTGNNYTNTTAVGANAAVSQNNSLVLGSINGVNNATADTRVGIGTTTPLAKLEVKNGNILVNNGSTSVYGGNVIVGSPGQGIVLKSPDGLTCRLLSIDNAGAMVLAAIACP